MSLVKNGNAARRQSPGTLLDAMTLVAHYGAQAVMCKNPQLTLNITKKLEHNAYSTMRCGEAIQK